mmetsp:Transcript_73122/g.128829  ORF Transcript_73122/g.128829 Transcript_73122/m.128829 type:complete len:229 (+) Transcript_73122:240-926(+)
MRLLLPLTSSQVHKLELGLHLPVAGSVHLCQLEDDDRVGAGRALIHGRCGVALALLPRLQDLQGLLKGLHAGHGRPLDLARPAVQLHRRAGQQVRALLPIDLQVLQVQGRCDPLSPQAFEGRKHLSTPPDHYPAVSKARTLRLRRCCASERPLRTKGSVRLSGASLAVAQNAAVDAIEGTKDHVGHCRLEDLCLRTILVQHLLKVEGPSPSPRDKHSHTVRLQAKNTG